MDRTGGVSDLRLMSGSTPLTHLEHAGLFMALANFTVVPGGFSWHVKSVLSQGQHAWLSPAAQGGFSLLLFTWALSSLYLLSLYTVFFLRANFNRRGANWLDVDASRTHSMRYGWSAKAALTARGTITSACSVLRRRFLYGLRLSLERHPKLSLSPLVASALTFAGAAVYSGTNIFF